MRDATPEHSTSPRVAIIVFPGSNGDRDMAEAFSAVGFHTEFVDAQATLPENVQVVALPGGFSYGDYWRAGMLASQAQAVLDVHAFCSQGGLVIGICNGFQILVEAGYLPGAIRYNDPPGFRHTWVELETTDAAKTSPWFKEAMGTGRWRMPRAHGEGNVFHPEGAAALTALSPMRYRQNPNGSMADAAALLAYDGRMLGIMPHPERACDVHLGSDDGLALFRSAYRHCAPKVQGSAE